MINWDTNYVEASTISQAWREVMWLCLESKTTIKYKIENASKTDEFGSFIGQFRLQLPYVTIKIKQPWIWEPFTSETSPFRPTDPESIDKYFVNYLMNDVLEPNEIYKYATWIKPQVEDIIKNLIISKGMTNQATINVGDNTCTKMSDPPCLRVMSFKAIDGVLRSSIFFRSWDLVCGMPENLWGFQRVKEYVLAMVNSGLEEEGSDVRLQDGEIIAYSDGLHIYSSYFDIVKSLNTCSEIALKRLECF
jgi:hypothetical protein